MSVEECSRESSDARKEVEPPYVHVEEVTAASQEGDNCKSPGSKRTVQVRRSTLRLLQDGYWLQSVDYPNRCLLLLFDGDIKVSDDMETMYGLSQRQQRHEEETGTTTLSLDVHAVSGLFTLELFSYVLIIGDSRYRGSTADQSIYEANTAVVLPLDYSRGKSALEKILGVATNSPDPMPAIAINPTAVGEGDSTPLDAAKEATIANNVPESTPPSWIPAQLPKFFKGIGYGNNQTPEPTSSSSSSLSSTEHIEGRVVDEIIRLFGTTGMFYSYDYDLTRSLQSKSNQPQSQQITGNELPLAQVADPDYWFNHHMQQPLIDCNAICWALPLIQGCVQMAVCELKGGGNSFQVCVLSRRNRQRIGMRYERRGADSNGNTANFVETEQVLAVTTDTQQVHYASFVQTRGSIPLYWKQPPVGLHPVPVLTKGEEENIAVCATHLQHEIDRCGRQILVNLVGHKGREATVGSAYASVVGQCVESERIDPRMARYVPWDFHYETRGMRYGALSELWHQLQKEATGMDYYWSVDDHVLTKQMGVFRVNCMDCLDRTNVVQSTLAKAVLNEQLIRLGVHISPEDGLVAYAGLEPTLNHLWANNGDNISQQYAGTPAMKGDFTRTGKRNFSGVLNDASFSLARLWINTFRDYFSQSVLDFTMGNQKASDVFRSLMDLRSREPEYNQQLLSMRVAAAEASVRDTLDGSNELVQLACIVLSPLVPNSKKLGNAPDCVLVLTLATVYICQFDYQAEIVSKRIKIPLADISHIQHGSYISDTSLPQSLDPTLNHGIMIYYESASDKLGNPQDHSCYIACKLVYEAQAVLQSMPSSSMDQSQLPSTATTTTRLESLESQTPDHLAECLCSMIQSTNKKCKIEEIPIVSVSEAKQNVTVVGKIARKFHKALWL